MASEATKTPPTASSERGQSSTSYSSPPSTTSTSASTDSTRTLERPAAASRDEEAQSVSEVSSGAEDGGEDSDAEVGEGLIPAKEEQGERRGRVRGRRRVSLFWCVFLVRFHWSDEVGTDPAVQRDMRPVDYVPSNRNDQSPTRQLLPDTITRVELSLRTTAALAGLGSIKGPVDPRSHVLSEFGKAFSYPQELSPPPRERARPSRAPSSRTPPSPSPPRKSSSSVSDLKIVDGEQGGEVLRARGGAEGDEGDEGRSSARYPRGLEPPRGGGQNAPLAHLADGLLPPGTSRSSGGGPQARRRSRTGSRRRAGRSRRSCSS